MGSTQLLMSDHDNTWSVIGICNYRVSWRFHRSDDYRPDLSSRIIPGIAWRDSLLFA